MKRSLVAMMIGLTILSAIILVFPPVRVVDTNTQYFKVTRRKKINNDWYGYREELWAVSKTIVIKQNVLTGTTWSETTTAEYILPGDTH